MLAAPASQNLHTLSVPRFVAAPEGSAVPAIHPLTEDLRAVAKDHLTTLLRDALAGAGRHFAARAERAEDASRRRDLLDALHILRLSIAVIQRTFGVELERAFSAGEAAGLNPHSAVVCISPSCGTLWQELSHRLQALNADQAVAAMTSGFSPEKIYGALRNSLDRTELPERAAVVIMELLDTGVMAHLDQLYRRMLERLDLYDLPEAGDELPAAANQSPANDAATSVALRVDARTKVLLARISRSPNETPDSKYTNAQLASELLQSVRHQAAREGVNAHDRAVIQRLALVGRLFATIGADEHLPDDFRQNLESLCFPVIKSALADSNFFSHDIHPLRVIGTNLVRKAADQFLSGGGESLDSLLQQAATHFDLSAAFVRPMLAGLRPLSAEAVENFLAELRAYPGAHTTWRNERAHEIVSRVLQRRLMGSELPDETMALINQHWASTLTQRLLEQGHDSAGWREDLAAVDALVARDSEQAAERYGSTPVVPAQVIPEPAEDIHAEPPAAALDAIPAKAQPRAPEALDALLQRGRWFRVYDHGQQSTRWLKVESYYPAHNSVAFAEFDGANPLCMEAAQFADDLCRGRSAPTNPDDQSRKVIAALRDAA